MLAVFVAVVAFDLVGGGHGVEEHQATVKAQHVAQRFPVAVTGADHTALQAAAQGAGARFADETEGLEAFQQ